jgi:CDP-glucose 4,6-dehydratase
MSDNILSLYSGKKVLITGHTGFKGSWLTLILDTLGASVFGYSLGPPTEPNMFTEARINQIADTQFGDVCDYGSLKSYIECVKPEIIFHMAAQPLVRQSYLDPLATYSTNVMGTANLLNSIRQVSSVKATVVITTDKCYENKEWVWSYRENEALGGYDPYSSSKACAELVTTAFRSSFFNPDEIATHGVGLASARAGNVIGGGDWATDRLIPDFIRSISKGDQLKIRNPTAIRPWQHVLEPLTGYLLLGLKLSEGNKQFSESWNFGPFESDARDVEWISATLCRLWGEKASYTIDGRNNKANLHEARYLKLDSAKAMTYLGWRPKWDIERSLLSVVEWHKNWQSGADIREYSLKQIESYYKS